MEIVTDFIFLCSKITAARDFSHEIKRSLLLGRKAITKLDSKLKSRDFTLLTKVHLVKAIVFPVVMHRCESWIIKKSECQRIDVFELWCWKRLEIPLKSKEIKQVNPKGNHSWRTDVEAETPILCWPNVRNWLIGKDPDAGKDWSQEEKGMTEDEMVWWYHWLDWLEFEQGLGVGDDREASVHGVSRSQTWLSDWTELKARSLQYCVIPAIGN